MRLLIQLLFGTELGAVAHQILTDPPLPSQTTLDALSEKTSVFIAVVTVSAAYIVGISTLISYLI